MSDQETLISADAVATESAIDATVAEAVLAAQMRIIDAAVRQARNNSWCEEFERIMGQLFPDGPPDGSREYVDSDGQSCRGLDRDGYNQRGYDRDGYNREGFDPNGRDRDGYDRDGYNRRGWNREGLNRDGRDRNSPEVRAEYGFDYFGYDRDGYNRRGLDPWGRTREQNAAQGIDPYRFNGDGVGIDGDRNRTNY